MLNYLILLFMYKIRLKYVQIIVAAVDLPATTPYLYDKGTKTYQGSKSKLCYVLFNFMKITIQLYLFLALILKTLFR